MSESKQFTIEHKTDFVTKCVHCGEPMGYASVDTWDKDGMNFVPAKTARVWIDPEHDCCYLDITPKSSIDDHGKKARLFQEQSHD